MKCDICGKECKGNLVVRDANIVQELRVCRDCLNDFANQEYEKLTKKLERKNGQKSKA